MTELPFEPGPVRAAPVTELPFEPEGPPEFLPVPDTESDEGELEVEPPVQKAAPTPPPEPPPAPVREEPTRSAQEIDEELERLRMHYIAGEIGREEYYRRKRELEEERNLVADGAEPRVDATPDMLSLDLDTSSPPEPSRPRPSRSRGLPLMQGRRIELGSDDSGL